LRPRRILRTAIAGLLGLSLAALLISSALAGPVDNSNVGWGGFGNTPDENRYSPLTQIDPGNVSQLGREFTVDFTQLVPAVHKGEQSYPVEADGLLYVTSGDDQVWALNAATGAVRWHWAPSDIAVFSDFGVVANRGVAVCDGHVFELTLDMNIVSLNPYTGALQREVPIADAVPGATVGYGYSETSAPICANHTLILGAAGSEYGVRGFVMAYHTNLTPAWPNPFWTVPPEGTEWRSLDVLAGGGVVWTPTTVDPTTDTLYFGTASATPFYFPSVRPGSDPRSDSLIAVDLKTGRMRWWQQQLSFNEWKYDTSQPPLVYTATIDGKAQRVVSVATMEGLWFAYNAATGRPIYQQVKVLDHTEHPNLVPGKPVVVFPSSIGGLNYSPASYDPTTGYVLNAAAETAAIETQAVLTPAQQQAKFTLGDTFLGLSNGNYGQDVPGYHDYGSISAISLSTGTQVWKFDTPQPERGGVTTTASGLGFAGGGDGNLRAFDAQTGKVLWTFQTGHQIAAGPSIYSVNGTEYVAITVGGTPTSSAGGTATQLQVFALGGSSSQSTAPVIPATAASVRASAPTASPARARVPAQRAGGRHPVAVAAQGSARIVTGAPIVVAPWDPNSSNVATVTGRVLWNGAPVTGATVTVDGYTVSAPTDSSGSFSYDIDDTAPGRRIAQVTGLSGAKVNGKPLNAAQKRAVSAASGSFSVAFKITGLRATVQKDGDVLVRGRVTNSAGQGPPAAHILTYQLSGKITTAAGQPVAGAIVITRTQDRDFWTRSDPSNAQGEYTSFFTASDESFDNPVIISVGVADGATSYGGALGTNVPFARLDSSVLNVSLGTGTTYTIAKPIPIHAAVYDGLVLGVMSAGHIVVPRSEQWPDAKGNFSMLLPSSVAGKTLALFEDQHQLTSSFSAKPGGPVDLRYWPTQLPVDAPGDLASLQLPRA
jgi:alcohol dehydrogenase (cytochrome c)